jgi:hypothetical protein
VQELIEQLEEDGLAYMAEHDQARMNPKWTAMSLQMEADERIKKRREYDATVRQFRVRNPGIKATTAELRAMIAPKDWAANELPYEATDDDEPPAREPTLGQTMMHLLTQMQKEIAELKKSKKDDEE